MGFRHICMLTCDIHPKQKRTMESKRYGNLCIDNTVFFLCDMQEKFRNAIKFFPEITEVASRLVPVCGIKAACIDVVTAAANAATKKHRCLPSLDYRWEGTELTLTSKPVQGSKILNIPLIVTEQYPKGLGNTVAELDISHAAGKYAKTKFSMVIPEVEDQMKTVCPSGVRHIVLFGIETHVCIQQTVIDLLVRNYEVHVVADGCSSRSQTDRVIALEVFALNCLCNK